MEKTKYNLEDLVENAFNYVVSTMEQRNALRERMSEKQFKEFIISDILIPRTMFNEYLKVNNLLISVHLFSVNYSNYFIKRSNKKRYIKLKKAVRVMDLLREREYLIRYGKRLEDLNEDLSLGLNQSTLRRRYSYLNKKKVIRLYFFPKLDEFGKTPANTCSFVFTDKDYGKVIAFELRRLILENMNKNKELITINEFSKFMGISKEKSLKKIQELKNSGEIFVYELKSLDNKILETYITPFDKKIKEAFEFISMSPEEKELFREKLVRKGSNYQDFFISNKNLLFPTLFFYQFLEKNEMYMVKETFFKKYKKMFINKLNENNLKENINYISFTNCLKIMIDLWKRKDMIENGKTIKDLMYESGIIDNDGNVSETYDSVLSRYSKLKKQGKIILKMYPILNNGEIRRQDSSFKFRHCDYIQFLEEEKFKIQIRKTYINKHLLAKQLNISPGAALQRINRKRKNGMPVIEITSKHGGKSKEIYFHPSYLFLFEEKNYFNHDDMDLLQKKLKTYLDDDNLITTFPRDWKHIIFYIGSLTTYIFP